MNNTITQGHFNQLSAASGEFRRVARINCSADSSSIFSFVRSEVDQLIPRCVCNTFRETMILDHAPNVQFFKEYGVKPIDEIPRELVCKVCATITNTTVDCRYGIAIFLALGFCQFSLIGSQKSRILYLFAIAQGGKRCLAARSLSQPDEKS